MKNLTATIDALGALKAQIADLKIREDELKASLADLDVGSYEGDLFRLSVTAPEREQISDELKAAQKAVIAEYRATLSHQYLRAHAPKVPVVTLTVKARIGRSLAA